MNSLVSFVVDGIAEHYYRTELLLFSLEKFGAVPRDRILVQCVDRVSQEFLAFLQDNGYTHRVITPFLDGKYCNKLQQLEGLEPYLGNADGIYLLDTDLAILAPFDVPDKQSICGKIVDLPNPPLHVLERIFSAAKLAPPAIAASDCNQGPTLNTNFNGGFLFIPREYIHTISSEWRSRATWLYARPELFENAQQFIHVDQVAMAMALVSTSLPAVPIPANYNLPLHLQNPPASFKPGEPIRILHYHRQISPFGLLFAAFPGNSVLDASVTSFNAALVAHGGVRFFDAYKRQQAETLAQTARQQAQDTPLHQLFSSRKLNQQPRRRLILHAGTPKTGTTSLQHYLHEQRPMLQDHGILYPSVPEATSASVPKHQWLIDDLLAENEAHLTAKMSALLDELKPETHTIILSTEGIFNHWWDFPPASKALLATLPNWFNTELWVWFREPASFMKSYYLQKLCNPRTQRVRSNGIDLSMEEMLQDDWIIRHLDYLGFMRDAQAAFGNNSVSAFAYDGSTLGAALKHLGLPPPPPDKEAQRHNVSLGEMGVSLIRVANRYDLNPAEKEQVTNLIKQLDAVVAKKCGPYILDNAARACINTYFALQENILKQEFGLSWADVQDKPAPPQAIAAPVQAVQIKRTRFF